MKKNTSYVGFGFWGKFEEKKMAELKIAFSEVWKRYRASGMNSESPFFSIGYRKKNGVWGYKAKVRRVAGTKKNTLADKKDMGTIKIEVRQAGTMELETESGERFELKAVGLMEFNGLTIDHRF